MLWHSLLYLQHSLKCKLIIILHRGAIFVANLWGTPLSIYNSVLGCEKMCLSAFQLPEPEFRTFDLISMYVEKICRLMFFHTGWSVKMCAFGRGKTLIDRRNTVKNVNSHQLLNIMD